MAPAALASSSSSPPPPPPQSRSRTMSAASSNRSSVNSGVGLGLRIPNAASSSFLFEKDVGQSTAATPSSHSPPTSLDTPRAPSAARSRGARKELDGGQEHRREGRRADLRELAAGVAGLQKESTIRKAKRVPSSTSKDHVRVCDDFRDALSRTQLSLLQQPSPSDSGPSRRRTVAPTSSAERQKEANDIANLLQQARLLSNVASQRSRNVALNGSATPPMEAVKRAIKDPQNGSRSNAQHAGDFTSASTPEGAMGRLALPPLTLNDGEDEISLSQSMFDALNMDVGPSSLVATDAYRNEEDEEALKNTSRSSNGDDQEALRSGLRFVLSCYDELSKRAKEDRGVADAIITSVVSEGHRLKAPAAAVNGNENGKAGNGPPSSSQRMNHQRMRTGSILKALARGKTNAALSGVKGGYSAWASGVTSPARATQMDFDAEPAYLVGPSNRLGMATHSSPWQQNAAAAAASPVDAARPDVLSPDSASRSRSSSGPSASTAPTEEVRQLRRKLIVVEEEKKRLMSEMESLSEELFLQANEMVKQERIKSNAIEKEFESLKTAMAASKVQQSNAAVASVTTAFSPSDFEAGSQGDKEAMMLSAIAQASRECAEAEEEAGDWRTHCEELQTRCSILEEALYNTMSLLAENGGQEVRDEMLAAVDTEVMPHREYAESNASFYSVDEAGSSDAGGELDAEQQDTGAHDTSFTSTSSDLSSSGLYVVDRKKDTQRASLHRPASFATEEGSVESSYSHPSSYSAHVSATSPRNSVVSSRRQSRQIMLPPRLPEPVSPLPSIPVAESPDGWAGNVRRRSGAAAAAAGRVNGRARGDSLGESKLRNSFTSEGKSAVVLPTSISTPNVLAPAFVVEERRPPTLEDNLSPKNTSAPFKSTSARPRSLLTERAEQDGQPLFSSAFAFEDNGWDERRRQADKALLNDEAGRENSGALPNSLALPSAGAAVQGLGAGLNRRHSLAHSTRSSDSKMSSSGSFGANFGQLSRNGSTVIKGGLRLFGSGSKSAAAEGPTDTATKTYISVKNVGRKMSTPSSTPHVDHGEPKRRQSAGANASSSAGASAKKSAKSAILGHMPPALPRGRSVASIASANGSLDSDDQRLQQHKVQYSPTEEHYMRSQHPRSSPTHDAKAFGRRRRFNDVASKQQQQPDMDDDYPAQQY